MDQCEVENTKTAQFPKVFENQKSLFLVAPKPETTSVVWKRLPYCLSGFGKTSRYMSPGTGTGFQVQIQVQVQVSKSWTGNSGMTASQYKGKYLSGAS